MLPVELNEIVQNIPKIDPDRNYWFVRTEGGLFYSSFVRQQVIAIGYNEVTTDKVLEAIKYSGNPKKVLTEYIKNNHPEIKRPGLAASQLIRFIIEIKSGDVVIIPSISTAELSFGIVIEDALINIDFPEYEHEQKCPYTKARCVEWVKSVRRSTLNPNLYSLFFARQTIVNGADYARYIDSTINDVYIKNGKAHLVIKVERHRDINARHLFKLGLQLLDVTDEFIRENLLGEDTDKVEVKTHLSSPGFIELAGFATGAVATVGLIMIAVSGGDFTSEKLGIKMKTPGLLNALTNFLNEKQKRNLLVQLSAELKTKEPKDLLEIIEKLK